MDEYLEYCTFKFLNKKSNCSRNFVTGYNQKVTSTPLGNGNNVRNASYIMHFVRS